MWWVVYSTLCVTLMALPDRNLRACLALSLAGLFVMQVFKSADLMTWQWLASAAVWSAVSVASWRHSVTFGGMTLVSAMCYAWGRIGGYDFAPSPPLFWADMAWLAAVAVTGGRCIVGYVSDICGSGGVGRDIRGADLNRTVVPVAKEAET